MSVIREVMEGNCELAEMMRLTRFGKGRRRWVRELREETEDIKERGTID